MCGPGRFQRLECRDLPCVQQRRNSRSAASLSGTRATPVGQRASRAVSAKVVDRDCARVWEIAPHKRTAPRRPPACFLPPSTHNPVALLRTPVAHPSSSLAHPRSLPANNRQTTFIHQSLRLSTLALAQLPVPSISDKHPHDPETLSQTTHFLSHVLTTPIGLDINALRNLSTLL